MTTESNNVSVIYLQLFAAPLFYITLQLLLFPFYDFPVGDDFSYLQSLINLRDGELLIEDWTSMPLIGQLILALPFAEIIDNIYLASRISSIFYMSIGLLWVSYLLKDERRLYHWLPVILVFQPDILHSYYFMTDGYFAMSMFIAILQARKQSFGISLIMFLLATSIRDISVVFLPLFVWYSWKGKDLKQTIFISLGYLAAYLLISIGFRELLLHQMGSLPELYDHGRERLANAFDKGLISASFSMIRSLYSGLVYLGLSLIPFALISRPFTEAIRSNKYRFLIGVITILCAGFIFLIPDLTYQRIGQQIFRYFSIIEFLDGNYLFLDLIDKGMDKAVSIIISVIGLLSLVNVLMSAMAPSKGIITWLKNNPELIAISIYTLILAPAGIFARYMILPYLLIASLLLLRSDTIQIHLDFRKYIKLAIVLLHCFMVNKGYINLKYATTELVESAEDMGATPDNMDAGFEYNAMHNYTSDFTEIVEGKWWWVLEDDYIIHTQLPASHNIIIKKEVFTYLPIRTNLYLGKEK